MTDVFISSAREDRTWVETLAAALEHAGLSVWWEPGARFGQSANDEIEQAFAAARAVIVVWSKAALAARSVKAETADALERGILIAVLKEAVVPPLAFRGLPGADLTQWTGGPDPALDAVVGQLRGPSGAPADEATRASAHPAQPQSLPPPPQAPDEERTVFQPRTLQAGEIIAHYRIVGPLGEGGSGAIFEARNIHNEDERVALKILQPDMADRAQFLAFLRAEANALQRVKNEAVVQYRTFGRMPDSDEFFLVIEYVEGPTLAAAMRERRFTVGEIRRLAVRIADGLDAAHAQNVIHRDLSPDNVVLPGGDPDRATLIDFGIARIGPIDQLGRAFAGKLSYAAPEQFGADPALIGPWSDLYSLGLLLAAAARGRKLDMGRDIATAIARRRTVPLLDGVPEALHGPLTALLQPLPAARVRSSADAAALFAAPPPAEATVLLSAAAAARPLISIRDPEPAPPHSGRPLIVVRDAPIPPPAEPRSRRWLWLGGAGALLAAAAVVLFLNLPAGVPPPAEPLPPVVDLPAEPPAPVPEPEPEPEPQKVAAPQGDDRLEPGVAAAARRAREAAALARDAEKRAVEAAKTAHLAETSAHAKAAEADKAAAIACAPGADSKRYFCGTPKGRDGVRYRGEVATGEAGVVLNGLGVLEDTAANVSYRGSFLDGQAAGEGVRSKLDPDGAGIGFDACAGRWTKDRLEPKGVCLWRAEPGGATRIAIAGGYQASKAEGPAVATFSGDGTYSGDFVAGGKSGHGVFVATDGTRAELAYAANVPGGGVIIVMRDGRAIGLYEGELGQASGLPNGMPLTLQGIGVFYGPDGAVLAQGRWKNGRLETPMGTEGAGDGQAIEPLPSLPALAPDPRLAEVLKTAGDAALQAASEAAKAKVAAADARALADGAAKAIADGELAAAKGRAAAKKACAKTPSPKGLGCFDTADGRHYAGEVTCTKAGICTSKGFGLLKIGGGWSYAGVWGKTRIESGCELENDAARYCGEETEPDKDASGRFMNADGLIGTGVGNAKAETFHGTFDFSAAARNDIGLIEGRAIKGLITGPGRLVSKLGSVYFGTFEGGRFSGSGKATTLAGDRIAARYAEGVASIGEITYADDRRYLGELSGDGFDSLPNGLGALFAANGRIERQGRWKDGALIEQFGPAGSLADFTPLKTGLNTGDVAGRAAVPDVTAPRAPP